IIVVWTRPAGHHTAAIIFGGHFAMDGDILVWTDRPVENRRFISAILVSRLAAEDLQNRENHVPVRAEGWSVRFIEGISRPHPEEKGYLVHSASRSPRDRDGVASDRRGGLRCHGQLGWRPGISIINRGVRNDGGGVHTTGESGYRRRGTTKLDRKSSESDGPDSEGRRTAVSRYNVRGDRREAQCKIRNTDTGKARPCLAVGVGCR